MKNIYWDKLSGFEKFIFILGWISAGNAIFWIVLVVVYSTQDKKGKEYKQFFNPHTFKVPFVFGFINLFTILAVILFFLFTSLIVNTLIY